MVGSSSSRAVGIAEKRLREQHANFLAALQLAHFAFVQRAFDAKAVEQRGGVGFGGVAAFFADNAFEFAEAHAVGVGQFFVGLGVERVALFERFPERGVAHDDGVDHAKLIERELILAQDAHFLRARDRAFGRLEFAGQDFHECGFAGAIGAGDGVAAPGHEGAGDVFEEDPGSEAHGDVVDCEHNPPIVA